MLLQCKLVVVQWLALALLLIGTGGLASSQEVFCGMGPPPGAPKFSEYLSRQFQQEQKLGYKLVCEADVDSEIERLRIWRRPWAGMPKLKFKPVPLENTPFSGFQVLRQSADIGGAALTRNFRTREGHYIELTEWDLSIDGGAVHSLDPNPPSEDINGIPARLYVLQAPSGRALSLVTWTEDRRNYTLRVDVNAKLAIRPNLLQLARALPKSEAAGARESGFKGFPSHIETK